MLPSSSSNCGRISSIKSISLPKAHLSPTTKVDSSTADVAWDPSKNAATISANIEFLYIVIPVQCTILDVLNVYLKAFREKSFHTETPLFPVEKGRIELAKTKKAKQAVG